MQVANEKKFGFLRRAPPPDFESVRHVCIPDVTKLVKFVVGSYVRFYTRVDYRWSDKLATIRDLNFDVLSVSRSSENLSPVLA